MRYRGPSANRPAKELAGNASAGGSSSGTSARITSAFGAKAMWLTTDRPIDEMDTTKLREIVALSDYYPPHVVMSAWEELLDRENASPVKSPLCSREAEGKIKALYETANRKTREGR